MGLCALVALATASCQKNEEKPTNILTAELNQPTCGDKTYIGTNYDLLWSEGDQIIVGDATFASHIFTATSSGTTHTTFTGNDAIDPNIANWAFYPINYVTSIDPDNELITFTVPATQTYVEGSFATNTYPMVARNGGNGTAFTFQGLFGVLAIPLTGNCTIGSVEFTDAAVNICGETSVNPQRIVGSSKSSFTITNLAKDNANTITLNCEGGLTLTSTPKVIMFTLRPLACYGGFTITVKDLYGDVIYTRSAAPNINNTIRPEKIILMPTLNIPNP